MCRRADIILAAALVLLSLLVFWLLPGQSGGTRTVTVLQDGKTIYEGPLAQNAVIELDGDYHNTVTIQGGVAAYTASTCPGQDCVHMGGVSQAGRMAACAPNRTVIVIAGKADESGVDFIAG